jgi:hypothetical protein
MAMAQTTTSAPARGHVDVAAAATVLVVSLLALSPVLWLLGALDEIEWHDDFVTGVIVAVVIYAAIATGYVAMRLAVSIRLVGDVRRSGRWPVPSGAASGRTRGGFS